MCEPKLGGCMALAIAALGVACSGGVPSEPLEGVGPWRGERRQPGGAPGPDNYIPGGGAAGAGGADPGEPAPSVCEQAAIICEQDYDPNEPGSECTGALLCFSNCVVDAGICELVEGPFLDCVSSCSP